jgi:dihydrofolate synthase/folylpolyglutamate synthase
MRMLVEALGHPERRFPSILIAGTNGKGSTAATLASILRVAGCRTGLYTSPHLVRVNERILIDGTPIPDEDFARYYFHVDDTANQLVATGRLPGPPSFFEALTALAFLAFADAGLDVAVLEVGMGGRLDATNVVEPLFSVITDISLDHTEWLGNTIAEIAREKAGILRPNGVLVTLPQHPQANQGIGEVAVELNVRGVNAAEYVPGLLERQASGEPGHPLRNQYPLAVLGQTIQVDSPLAGDHQRRNLALAIAAAVELNQHPGFGITASQIEEGIRRTEWPGRLELFSRPGRPGMLVDVAHNPAGAWALRAALSGLETRGRRVLVFGCMQDKAFEQMAQILFPLFDRIVATPVASPRSATVEQLLAAADRTGVPAVGAADARAALACAEAEAQSDGLVVVAGSVYLAGELRPVLAAQPAAEAVSTI